MYRNEARGGGGRWYFVQHIGMGGKQIESPTQQDGGCVAPSDDKIEDDVSNKLIREGTAGFIIEHQEEPGEQIMFLLQRFLRVLLPRLYDLVHKLIHSLDGFVEFFVDKILYCLKRALVRIEGGRCAMCYSPHAVG